MILTLVHVKHCSVQVGLAQAQNIELENNDKEQSDLKLNNLHYYYITRTEKITSL